MIKYKYAYDSNEETVNVRSLSRDMELGEFYCIGCEGELIPRLGEKRQKHFAHKVDQNCSPETYLHRLAKNIFHDLYKDCLENQSKFILEYSDHHFCNHFENEFGLDCDLGNKTKDFDLISYFSEIEMEKKDGNLIPDVRIYNPKTNESIYIEVAVTHEVEDEKRASGKKIIEFLINEESDIELVKKKRIKLNNDQINRFNFKDKYTKKDFCQGKCKVSKNVFIVYDSGKSILAEKKLNSLNALIKNAKVVDYRFGELDQKSYQTLEYAFIKNVIKSREKGIDVKNCFLCRYHARNNSSYSATNESIFCKFLKESFQSNYASKCEYYRPDKEVYAEYLDE